jgi:superoxide reductase
MSKMRCRASLRYALVGAAALAAVLLLTACGKKPVSAPPASPKMGGGGPTGKGYTSTAELPKAADTTAAQTAADPAHMTGSEQVHVPQFALPATIEKDKPITITVNVGQKPHPMTAAHHIEWVSLYLDGTLVKKVDLALTDKPMATFEVTLTPGAHQLKAQENCNLHGLWENSTDVTAS